MIAGEIVTVSVLGLIAAINLALIGMDTYHWVRAWLYVRFFIRYEMAGCAIEAKVREGNT